MRKLIGAIISAVVMMAAGALTTMPKAFAAECGEDGVETSVLGTDGCVEGTSDGSAIFDVLNIVLQVLTFGVAIAGTFAIVIVGIQFMTAKDNAGQLAAAKTRLIAIIIGLAAYAVMWAFLQWLLPGGIFGN